MQAETSEKLADTLYTVEKILDKVVVAGKIYYWIKWKGYPISQATWEPIENLHTIIDLLVNFEVHGQNADQSNAKKRHTDRSLSDEEKEPEKRIKGEKTSQETHSNNKDKFEKEEFAEEELNIVEMKKDELKQVIRGEPDQDKAKRPAVFSWKEEKLNPARGEDRHDVITQRIGSLTDKDKPKMVLKAEILSGSKCRFLVSWELDSNGVIPEPSYVTNQELKNSNPVFLIEYYEKLIKHNLIKSGQYHKLPKFDNKETVQPEPLPEEFGSLAFHDKPKSIINIQNFYQSGCDFLVGWHERCSGAEPHESVISSKSFKTHDPLFLIEYYENKLKPSPDYAESITIDIPEEFHYAEARFFVDEFLKGESTRGSNSE